MKSRVNYLLAGACVLLLLGAGVREGRGQGSHSLSIQDGRVYVDGEQVPPDEVPASLSVDSVSAHFSFSGVGNPIIELGGALYSLQDKRLVEVTDQLDQTGGVQVFLQDDLGALRQQMAPPSVSLEMDAPGGLSHGNAPTVLFFNHDGSQSLLEQRAQELQAYMNQLERMGAKLDQAHSADVNDFVYQVRANAERAAQVAGELPHVELQGYLHDMQAQNEELYNRLVHEQQQELATRRLAARIRALPEGAEREGLKAQLRDSLQEIFEVKQENRRREIEQLKTQLGGLQDRLQDREQQRTKIIERRLQQLIGEASAYDW